MVFRGRKSVLKKEQMARQKSKAGGRGNIWRASRCSHSACRSSRPGQSDLSNIGTLWSPGGVNKAHKHRDRTPSQRHSRRPRRPPEATPIWAAFWLQKEPTSHSSQSRPPACGMCMPNLPPPCPRSQRRPMGGRRWPLSCGRLASCWGERRSRRSRLHALLRPCGLSPTGIQSVAASRPRRTLCDLHEEAVEKIPLRPGQRPEIQTVVGSPMVIPSQTRER